MEDDPAGGSGVEHTIDDDGPKVEKGGVAQILRQGNVAPGAPTWTLNRTLYTKSFATFNAANSGMAAADADFVRGLDIDTADNSTTYALKDASDTQRTTTIRNTIQGGVVHSRTLPVNYGGGTTVLYDGSDDGTYRAVDSVTGRELRAYIPEEFYPTLPRLRTNIPLVKYSFRVNPQVTPPPAPKNDHFDGSTGAYRTVGNSKVWIFPTMRRGGRMVYAFNVTNPASPVVLWKSASPRAREASPSSPCSGPADLPASIGPVDLLYIPLGPTILRDRKMHIFQDIV
jgi:type IV pilus assembly protein PilY1